MHKDPSSLPSLRADLLLLHAPAFFDFRERRDIYFPFLGTSGDVPITPLYEYFPLGFKTLQRFLSDRGHIVKIINLSSVLLQYPHLEFCAIVNAFDVKLIGIDLHWMVHVQGSLAVAEGIKALRPDLRIVLGGISSTYYAHELIHYGFIDMIMRGYDTHRPMDRLLRAIRQGEDLAGVPNLVWKLRNGQIVDNGLSYSPGTFGCGIDWSQQPKATATETLPILEVLSSQNAGCSYRCGWCGGSRHAFRRIFGSRRPLVRKSSKEISYEFDTLKRLPGVSRYHFYSVGSYNNSKTEMKFLLDRVAESHVGSISYEQYHLTPDDVLEHMARANSRTTITLSPESHDLRVARLAGRGVYTNEELEHWVEKAMTLGIYKVDLWYFIGMPEQDEVSVLETLDYCRRLLEKFKGARVNPMICPMIPFLDPASYFFEHPDAHGYRVFYRTVDEHRRGMLRASIINRINYETKWLTRSQLVQVGFQAVRQLTKAKAEFSLLPRAWAEDYASKIDDAMEFVDVVHEVDEIGDESARLKELDSLGNEILRRNNSVLFSGVNNQAFPINRQIGGRWFDELGWEATAFEASRLRAQQQ